MTRIDLTKGRRSLRQVLTLAKSQSVLIHSDSGEDFLLEHADDFDQEAAKLGASEKFKSFLDDRSKEIRDIPLRQLRKQRRHSK